VLEHVDGPNIYKLGPIYDDQRFDLLSAADGYFLPGAVGLRIVDAFHCGVPFVTEEGDESAEIADGVNGSVLPRWNVSELLRGLELRQRYSVTARTEVVVNANIE
jgi:glycosyltransferase involved in cell wall biosynthesis